MKSSKIEVYDPCDVFDSIEQFRSSGRRAHVTMFDPWYNKGIGGVRDDYVEYITSILRELAAFSDHIYFWGFPEIVARFIDKIPKPHAYNCWLTWYYKNNPSVIRGWRSAQMTCLHTSAPDAVMYPEHFLNEAQLEKKAQGKLRYMPGPPSVIEGALIIGFVGKKEQTGHPAQKPVSVYEHILKMVTKPGDLVFDPMCGSGTTAEAAMRLGVDAVVSDMEENYVEITRDRVKRVEVELREAATIDAMNRNLFGS